MNKKTIMYVLGGVAILGIGFYMLNKNKKTAEQKESLEETKDTTSVLPVSPIATAPAPAPATPPAPVKQLTNAELELKLVSCGKKPKSKKNKREYDKCRSDIREGLKAQGLVSFDGSYSMDESVVEAGFFSNFENSLNLDL